MPPTDIQTGRDLVERRSPEWHEHQLGWRWLLDSLEGGDRYKHAFYGIDSRGLPVRNLVRHKREYPDPREQAAPRFGAPDFAPAGQDESAYATLDDYELRRARTPVPTFVAEAVDSLLDKIYEEEVDRDAPETSDFESVRAWWNDVNGVGTTVDDWMRETAGRLVLTLGQLDVLFDHPKAPRGEDVASQADVVRLGLDRCVASYILPENMLWWELNPDLTYSECLVREYPDGGGRDEDAEAFPANRDDARYRHWTARGSTLYDREGVVLAVTPHPYGCVPIVRVFDRRKPRCRNVGQSRMFSIAERQREYYNRDSELILSDTTQAHPLLQGPEDFIQADGTIPVGPSWLLPKKKNTNGGSTYYEGFDVVDFPKGGADSIRQNKQDIRDAVDRDAGLLKPAGIHASVTGQSGIAKMLDHDAQHAKLSSVSKMLAKAEVKFLKMMLVVAHDGNPPAGLIDQIEVSYPSVFSLYAAEDLAKIAGDFMTLLADSGGAPDPESAMLCELVRKALPGRDDDTYDRFDKQITAKVNANANARDRQAESLNAPGGGGGAGTGDANMPVPLGSPTATPSDIVQRNTVGAHENY